jgi:RNA polymerase sigma-70 factor (ECF subfamily)
MVQMTMGEDAAMDPFEGERPRLWGVAYRLLGSAAEADDAMQEAWLRYERADTTAVENLAGWLTTVVSRIALDRLRARAARREDSVESIPPATVVGGALDPEEESLLADSVGTALVVVLDTLAPAERLALVLHDVFAVAYDEIGAILDRSPVAAKQLAHRARAKVRGAAADARADADPGRRRSVVDAFLAAARSGDFAALVALLHPDVVLEADGAAVAMGSPGRLAGADAVAGMFSGRALGAECAAIDGIAGLVWIVGDRPKVAWDFAVEEGRVVHIGMLADQGTLAGLTVRLLPSDGRS